MYGFPASEEQDYITSRQAFVRAADCATVVFNILFLFRGLKLEFGNFAVSDCEVCCCGGHASQDPNWRLG
jgi:hypothetical protein